ncbi:MAG: hypothetical protein WB460_02785 [Candidatus Acidiferrales bacterium]
MGTVAHLRINALDPDAWATPLKTRQRAPCGAKSRRGTGGTSRGSTSIILLGGIT